MSSRILSYFTIFIVSIILASCGKQAAYNDCNVIEGGWHKDSVITFTPTISDTINRYNIIVTVRHNTQYQYQNFWMFVVLTSPEGLTANDTIECFLADNKGNYLGTGISIFVMPILLSEKVQFEKGGEYKFDIAQGMRDTILSGIEDICLTIEKSN